MITIDEIMSTDLVTLRDSDKLDKARALMSNKHIHHIPVLDEYERLVGLITYTDILAASESILHDELSKTTDTTQLKEIMTTNLITADEHTSLLQAAINLLEHDHGCLPVVDGEKLIGIVTDSDFVAVAVNLLEQKEISDFDEDDGYNAGDSDDFKDIDIDVSAAKNWD